MKIKAKVLLFVALLLCFEHETAFSFGFDLAGFKKSVVFIFIEDDSGRVIPNGTGFYLGVDDEKKQSVFPYLVTAKHVLLDRSGRCFPAIYIRVNKKNQGPELVKIPLNPAGIHKTMYTHPDTSVDIAVLNIFPKPDTYDFSVLPERLLMSPQEIKEFNIKEGTEIFFIGLFTPYFGYEHNFPITRFGKIAMITSEKIYWDNLLTELLLIECGSFGGNSGSPVFYVLGPDEKAEHQANNLKIVRLAGVMKGSYQDLLPVQILDTSKSLISRANMGISAIVPASKLFEIIYSAELISKRK